MSRTERETYCDTVGRGILLTLAAIGVCVLGPISLVFWVIGRLTRSRFPDIRSQLP